MIDHHCHILPGLDDGAASIAESIEIARTLAEFGFTEVCCTPHVIKGVYEPSRHEILQATRQLQAELDSAGIGLILRAQAEYYLDEYLAVFLEEASCSSDCSPLVEAPQQASADAVLAIVRPLLAKGRKVTIAHPERCLAFTSHQERGNGGWLAGLLRKGSAAAALGNQLIHLFKEAGCGFQGNIGSFAGYYGDKTRTQALRLLEDGVYTCLGSDAHRVAGLGDILRRGIETIERTVGKEAAGQLLCNLNTMRMRGCEDLRMCS